MEKNVKTFKSFGLKKEILAALEAKGFEQPTEIQQKSLEIALESNANIVGKAQTGTGKTAAFGLPILQNIDVEQKAVQTLILCPTRELAKQVTEELRSLRGELKIFVSAMYGGHGYEQQLKSLRLGDQVIVGTPGRIIDHLKSGKLNLDALKYLVLDEADEMLNMGFIKDLEKVLEHIPQSTIKYLFSATMNDKIKSLISKYVPEYKYIEVKRSSSVTSLSTQQYLEVRENQKHTALTVIIDQDIEFYGIVFCRTKRHVDQLKDDLRKRGYKAACIHGDIPQKKREHVLRQFRNREVTILVATDVAARGIDIDDLSYVVNYHLPEDSESYVHRVGRTGRAGKEGRAISLVSGEDYQMMNTIRKETKIDLEKLEPFTKADMQQIQLGKLIGDLADYAEHVGSGYDEVAANLLEEFDAKEVVQKLLQRIYGHVSFEDLQPIDTTKAPFKRGRRKGGRGRTGGRRGSSRRRSGGGFSRDRGGRGRQRSRSGAGGSEGRSRRRSR